MNNDWFSITGESAGNSGPRHYVFVDDVRLYRPCDVDLECWPAHGQICPTIATPLPPSDPMRVIGIEHADRLQLELYSQSGALVFQDFRANANGMPDYTLSRLALPAGLASAIYDYRITLRNGCGATVREGKVNIQDTTIYNLPPVWEDATHNWSGVPIPCCLDSLVLFNTTIRGDVSYIVGDYILVAGNVSAAAGSHVILQAGQVVELEEVEFDGSTSTVDIVEIPCPNRVAQGSCQGGSMTILQGLPQVGTTMQDSTSMSMPRVVEPMTDKLKSSMESKLSVSPNPTDGQLKISWESQQPNLCRIEVLDLQGRLKSLVLDSPMLEAGMHSISADLSGLPVGVYLLRWQVGGQAGVQKVVRD